MECPPNPDPEAEARAREYGSCLEASLNTDNVPVSVYEYLVRTIKENTAPVHRYIQLRKKALKPPMKESGRSDYPMNLLLESGVDLSQPEPILAIVDQLDTLATQLQKEIGRRG